MFLLRSGVHWLYVPPVLSENVACVVVLLGFVNVSVPGPLTLLHESVNVLPESPSSVAAPSRVTELVGSVIVWFGPALTTGA